MAIRRGTSKKDILKGTAASDALLGFGGNDVLRGGVGDDTLRGGVGHDRLFGEAGHDRVFGDAGNDTLDGGTGFNILEGGTGNDTLFGDQGVNIFRGGAGVDIVSYANSTSSFGALGLGVVIQGNSGNDGLGVSSGDLLDSIEVIIGTRFVDSITGFAGSVFGLGGDDGISDVTGNASGGDGNDTIDDVDGSADGGDGSDTISNVTGTAFGGPGDDTMTSRPVLGGTLRGGEGFDLLIDGGAGVTRFWLEPGMGYDDIVGFDVGTDKILIAGSDFGIGPTLDANEFTDAGYVGTNPQFRFSSLPSALYFDFDGAGTDWSEILIATFEGGSIIPSPITIADFELF